MGQRSQIYVKADDKLIIANYYQWNYAERMVSRARYGIEWILGYHFDYPTFWDMEWNIKKLSRILDVNFDYKDVALSSNIMDEYDDYGEGCDFDDFVYRTQDNNDGKLFIQIDTANKKIKYAFTDYDITRPLTPDEYMEWEDDSMGETYEKRFDAEELKTYRNNAAFITDHAELMTEEELEDFTTTKQLF